MGEHTVTVIDNRTGKQIELPVRQSSQGPDAVDIGRFLRAYLHQTPLRD